MSVPLVVVCAGAVAAMIYVAWWLLYRDPSAGKRSHDSLTVEPPAEISLGTETRLWCGCSVRHVSELGQHFKNHPSQIMTLWNGTVVRREVCHVSCKYRDRVLERVESDS